MTTDVVTVDPETPFKDLVWPLMEHDVSGLPVVDAPGSDIRARLADPAQTPEDQAVTFRVADGVVDLEGSVPFDGDRLRS